MEGMGASNAAAAQAAGSPVVERPARRFPSGPAIVASIAAFTAAIHLATAGVYGLFIDELYFLAAGEHLSWGYVDFPPLTALQAWLTRALFGDSMLSIRLFPALAATGLVLLTGAFTRALGGGRFAQALSALAVAVAPVYLAFDSYLSMNSIEPLVWTGCALILVRIIHTGRKKLWIAFGAVAGIGMLNKHTMLMFAFALIAGLALTRERKALASWWVLVGGLVAFLVFLPNLLWIIRNHFPHLELLENIRRNQRDVAFEPLVFIGLQLVFMNPVAAPIWVIGLGWYLFAREARSYRALGYAYLIALTILIALGKFYYLAPAYPMLFAQGAVAMEEWAERLRWAWFKPAYAAAVLLCAALIAPTVMPMLTPDAYVRYTKAIGFGQPRFENRRPAGAMPQFFADRFGWPEMAQTVAHVYRALPPEERAKTGIFANDFGQGGAIDFYGPKLGLPKAIGNHLGYWYWGPRHYTGDSLIVLGDNRETLESKFEEVRAVGEVGHPLAMQQEHFTVFLCRRPKAFKSLQEAWPSLKNFN
jgi:dolichyl-phosphate-mannose-protein mannosyltransferase